jgi:hypothetical protein
MPALFIFGRYSIHSSVFQRIVHVDGRDRILRSFEARYGRFVQKSNNSLKTQAAENRRNFACRTPVQIVAGDGLLCVAPGFLNIAVTHQL